MKLSKKFLSVLLSLLIVVGSFVVSQAVVMASEYKTDFNLTLAAGGKNATILTGPKNNANYNYSTISLTGGTVDHINAWIVDTNGKKISKYKYKVIQNTNNKKMYYDDGKTVSKGTITSIRIEQNNILSKTAKGNANIK